MSTQRSRAGLKYSAPAELKCGKWDIARKLESDGPRERGARSGGVSKTCFGGTAGTGCGKLGKADSLRLPLRSAQGFGKQGRLSPLRRFGMTKSTAAFLW